MTDKKKSVAEEKEEKEVEEKAEAPKWAVELGAKFDKMADAFLRMAEAKAEKQEDEEEEKPEEEEKQDEEEEKPEEEEKQDEEEEEEAEEEEKQEEEEEEKPPEEEEKLEDKINAAVDKAVKKRFTSKAEKRSKVPKDLSSVLTYEKIAKMSWTDIEKEAEKRGAPGKQ